VPDATNAQPAATRPRVLVVDDSRVIRKAVQKILGAEFDLIEAEDGEQGWEKLAADSKIEVVISDIEMPKLDGYGFLCRIRAADDARVHDVPTIVITGAQDDQTRERALACGATDFITKPLDGVQLLARTRAHARLDEALRELAAAEASIEEHSATDALTGLATKRVFLQRGAQDLAYAKRHEHDFSLVLFEVDNFVALHASHGGPLSSELQRWVAGIATEATRTEDSLARVGEGLFGVLAPGTGRMDVAVLCERLRTAVNRTPFRHETIELPITISLGIATDGRDPGDGIDQLLVIAEKRLILAKADGGNRIGAIYQDEIPEPEVAVMARPDLDTALKMLAQGQGGQLLPYLPELAAQVLPLLDHCNEQLALGLEAEIEALKLRLSELQ
jgi:diguanylate cyclase (GGDEF)-like protein